MIDPLYIYEVLDSDGRSYAGPYRLWKDAERARRNLCYQIISVFEDTTEEDVLKEFALLKSRFEEEGYRYTIRKTEVL